jgi:elongator complex protein 6
MCRWIWIFAVLIILQAIDLNEAGEAGRFVYHDGLSTSALPPRIQQSSQPTKSAQYVHVLQSHDLNYTKSAILASRAAIPTDAEVLLILDSPDYLLGMLSCSASELLAFIMSLRQAVHSTVLTLQSDVFSQAMPAKSLSPLQTQQQQFLLSLAHQADRVLATRGLDSGSARDVSGVVRVTRGGRAEDDETAECPADVEWLYQVDMNRAARVWERGTDASGR